MTANASQSTPPETLFFVLAMNGKRVDVLGHAETQSDAEKLRGQYASGRPTWIVEAPYACAALHPNLWPTPPRPPVN